MVADNPFFFNNLKPNGRPKSWGNGFQALPDGTPGPSLYCAVIVKRVDEKTRSKTSINELLRD